MSDSVILPAFDEVACSRRSVRAFLPATVDQATLNKVFGLAQTAPSNCNTQPWLVKVVGGDTIKRLKKSLPRAVSQGRVTLDFPYEGRYCGVYKERQHAAAQALYRTVNIPREDKAARRQFFMSNYEFFGAPHVAFLFMQDHFGLREAADVGMYAQNLMLALQAYGLASCPQTSLGFYAQLIREELAIDASQKLLFGISFGYADGSAAVNAARTDRSALRDTVTFYN